MRQLWILGVALIQSSKRAIGIDEVCSDSTTGVISTCYNYRTSSARYCEMGKEGTVRRRNWGGNAYEYCQSTCGYCKVKTYTVSGSCTSACNGDFVMQGTTASGAPYYKNALNRYIYFDPDCNGQGFAASWICDSDAPSLTATSDLDEDGSCSVFSYRTTDENNIAYPAGNQTWTAYCDGAWVSTYAVAEARPYIGALTLSGHCGDVGTCNGEFSLQGVTQSGAPYYKLIGSNSEKPLYIYYDPDCSGSGAPGRWICGDFPNVTAANSLASASGGGCTYNTRIDADHNQLPLGTNTWRSWCNFSTAWEWGDNNVAIQARYPVTALGEITCPQGFTNITNRIDCAAIAASTGLFFEGYGNYTGYPAGCMWNNNLQVWYNDGEAAVHTGYGLICQEASAKSTTTVAEATTMAGAMTTIATTSTAEASATSTTTVAEATTMAGAMTTIATTSTAETTTTIEPEPAMMSETTTTMQVSSVALQMSGWCPSQDVCNGGYALVGFTHSGTTYYKKEAPDTPDIYLFYDPDCSGKGTSPSRWICSDEVPNATAASDIDGDGTCTYRGRINSDTPKLVWGTHVWRAYCASGWEDITVTLEASYAVSMLGAIECPRGFIEIALDAVCGIAARALGQNYSGTISSASMQKGCVMDADSHTVRYNGYSAPGPLISADTGVAMICQEACYNIGDTKDSSGLGCDAYWNDYSMCGNMDDDDFNAYMMCCACGGGSNTTTTTTTATPTVIEAVHTVAVQMQVNNISQISDEATFISHITTAMLGSAGANATNASLQVMVTIEHTTVDVVFGGFDTIHTDDIIWACSSMMGSGIDLSDITVNGARHSFFSTRRLSSDAYVSVKLDKEADEDIVALTRQASESVNPESLAERLRNQNATRYATLACTLPNPPSVGVSLKTVVTGTPTAPNVSSVQSSIASTIPGGASASVSVNTTMEIATTTPPPRAGMFMTRGFCRDRTLCNGVFVQQGTTASGAPWFKKDGGGSVAYMYHDPSCDGSTGFENWICDSDEPDPSKTADLDGDESCNYHGRINSPDADFPPEGTNTWTVNCASSWVDNAVTLQVLDGPTTTPMASGAFSAQCTDCTCGGTLEDVDFKYLGFAAHAEECYALSAADSFCGYLFEMPSDYGSCYCYHPCASCDRSIATNQVLYGLEGVVTTTKPQACTTVYTTTPNVAGGLYISGFCSDRDECNGIFYMEGNTANGAAYFKKDGENVYYYHDPCCSGSCTSSMERWICDSQQPSLTATQDLDGDGGCNYYGRVNWQQTTMPMGTHTWRVYCDAWVDNTVTVTELATTTQYKPPTCGTVGNMGVGAGYDCVFPFVYGGKTYSECIKGDKTVFWCPTEVNSGEIVADKFGECDPDTCTKEACVDTDNGATDSYDTGCDQYKENPNWCGGGDDDDDFSSDVMCCVCGGGELGSQMGGSGGDSTTVATTIATTSKAANSGATCTTSDIMVELAQCGEVCDLSACSFSGVTIPNEVGEFIDVKHLHLTNTGLVGAIPSTIGLLTNIITLRLDANRLTNTIPSEIGNLTKIEELVIGDGNTFAGNIPSRIGLLTKLAAFTCHACSLVGSIPDAFWNLIHMVRLDLGNNQLTGTISSALGRLGSIEYLDLANNRFIGSIPSGLGNLTNMTELHLQNIQLGGAIPSEIGRLVRMTHLYLSNNKLINTIPPEIGNCTHLQHLYLDNNHLNGAIPSMMPASLEFLNLAFNLLTGAIPIAITKAIHMTHLWLQQNHLTGVIPQEIGNLANMQEMRLFSNSLTGPLPAGIGNQQSLVYLLLGSNHIDGPIPPEIGDATSLIKLELQANALTGRIPERLGNANKLEQVHLEQNSLTGEIPAQVGSLTNVVVLSLHSNMLDGNIPVQFGTLTKAEKLLLQHNKLGGPIPAQIGGLTAVQELHLENNSLTGNVPSQIGDLINMQALGLSNNMLTGEFPDISAITGMVHLSISGNKFSTLAPNMVITAQQVDFSGNELTEFPEALANLEKSVSLNLSNNKISRWTSRGVMPQHIIGDGGRRLAVQCGYSLPEPPPNWPMVQSVDISGNPIGGSVRDFLYSLSHTPSITTVSARGCNLHGSLTEDGFRKIYTSTGDANCNGQEINENAFQFLMYLDLSDNSIDQLKEGPRPWLTSADFRNNNIAHVDSKWWNWDGSNRIIDFRVQGNPDLRETVWAPGICPASPSYFMGDVTKFLPPAADASHECTVPCRGRANIEVDATISEALCRCRLGYGGQGDDCSACPVDTYEHHVGDDYTVTQCHPCPASSSTMGNSMQSGLQSCRCGAGSIMNMSNSECKECPAGDFYSTELGQCAICTAGSFSSEEGAMACTPCNIGFFAVARGATACQACPQGKSTSTTGASECTSSASGCPAGEYLNTSIGSCVACAEGYFSAAPGAQSCQACASGSFANARGQTSCADCPIDHTSKVGSSSCVPCPATFKTNIVPHDGVCHCMRGHSGESISPDVAYRVHNSDSSASGDEPEPAVECSPCTPGQFKAAIGPQTCQLCAPGSYSSLAGASQCTNCPGNTQSGSRNCSGGSSCSAGMAPNSQGTCEQCPTGRYASAGAVVCQLCSAGSAPDASQGSCSPCSGSAVAGPGDAACSVCSGGSIPRADLSGCTQCGGTEIASPGDDACTACGFMSTPNEDRDSCAMNMMVLILLILVVISVLLCCCYAMRIILRSRRKVQRAPEEPKIDLKVYEQDKEKKLQLENEVKQLKVELNNRKTELSDSSKKVEESLAQWEKEKADLQDRLNQAIANSLNDGNVPNNVSNEAVSAENVNLQVQTTSRASNQWIADADPVFIDL